MRAGAKTKSPHLIASAFTLIELLVVVAIMMILLFAVTSGTGSMASSSELASASSQVASIFSRAREVATTTNESVQVRFYEDNGVYNQISLGIIKAPTDPNAPNYSTPADFEFEKVEKHYHLPDTVAFLEGSPYSEILDHVDVTSGTENVGGTMVPYKAITFTSTRQINLSSAEDWTLTVVLANAVVGQTGSPSLPSNYATITLHPHSGRATVTRP